MKECFDHGQFNLKCMYFSYYFKYNIKVVKGYNGQNKDFHSFEIGSVV